MGGEGGHSLLALSWNPAARLADFPQVLADARRAASEHTPAAPLIFQKALTPDGWRLEGAATQRLLDKLRRGGKPLGEYVNGRLYRGLITGFNDAWIVTGEKYKELIAHQSNVSELFKPILRGRDIKRWGIEYADFYLIQIESTENKKQPWSNLPDAEAENVFEQMYPTIHAWFNRKDESEDIRRDLIDRADKGKYFWEMRSCKYWHEFNNSYIAWGNLATHPKFTIVSSGYRLSAPATLAASNSKYLLSILNSVITQFIVSQNAAERQGGFLEYKPMYISQIPIPAASSSSAIEALVTQILAAKAANPAADVAAQEREIDERVYALYGLRPDEVRMIEESVRR